MMDINYRPNKHRRDKYNPDKYHTDKYHPGKHPPDKYSPGKHPPDKYNLDKKNQDKERLREIIKRVRTIELKTRRPVNSLFQGAYRSVFKGRGIEFSEVREYRIGDDTRTIDWNVTARMNHPYVKEFIEERDITVILAVDISASFDFGSRDVIKQETAIEIAASIAFSALKNNDRVGLVLFTNHVERYIPPKSGRNQVLRIIREILYYEPSEKTTSLDNCIKFLSRIIKKRSIVFILSDFADEIATYKKAMKILNTRHDIICMNIRDVREMEIPDVGYIELEDEETGEQLLVDTSDPAFREAFAGLVNSERDELKKFYSKLNIDFIDVMTHENWIKSLMKFFDARERRMVG